MLCRKLSITQKKIIFIIGMGLLFLVTAFSVYILDLYTNSDIEAGDIFVDFLAIYIGICIGSIIQNIHRNKKIISMFFGAGFILLTGWFLNHSVFDATESLCGYFISYWIASMFSKLDPFGLYSDNQNGNDNSTKNKSTR
jgi:hypothetical protein